MGRLIIPIVLLIVVAGVSINATMKDNLLAENSDIEFPIMEDTPETLQTIAAVDTTRPRSKSKSVTRSKVNGNGKSYSVTKENGEITEMKVDGKKIAPNDYDKYERELGDNSNSDGFHFDLDTDDMTPEQKERLEKSMEALGKSMENFGESLGEGLGKSMEKFGEHIEEWAEDFENDGAWKEFEHGIAKWGEEFGKSFGEDFGKEMAEWGENFGRQFADGFAFDFDTEEMERLGDRLEKRVEEYRMKHPEKFYQGGDGEWHLKNDNLSFEESEEIFGEGWAEDLGDNITKMMEGFKFDFDDEDFDLQMPPAPPAFRNAPTPPTAPAAPAAPFKLEMKDLKSALESDGFFKNDSKVTFKMDENNLSINGKNQPSKVYKKYKKIIESNWGADYLEEYEIDFNIIDKAAKKKMTGTYRI